MTISEYYLLLHQQLLLGTAIVRVQNSIGQFIHGRVLLDSCSVSSFINESFGQVLKLPRSNACVFINKLGRNEVDLSKGYISITVLGIVDPSPFIFIVLAFPKITSTIPSTHIKIVDFNHIKEINLADPMVNIPSDVDMLNSVELFSNILRPGSRKGCEGKIVI